MVETELVAGWDIGGVHVKGVRVATGGGRGIDVRTVVRPFEIWRAPRQLPVVLREVARTLDLPARVPMGAVMTAELSDAFASKREGVTFVVESLRSAFPEAEIKVLDSGGRLVPLAEVQTRPLDFAATNWVASALYLARRCENCLMIDTGSTTTDIVPVMAGRIGCEERTDEERLAGGLLVYTGVVRTNPNTIVDAVPLRGAFCRVAAEYFCVMADVYVLLDVLSEEAYTCPTPDGGPRSPAGCAARLSRLVCADRETVTPAELRGIARYLAERQVQLVCEGVAQVLSRFRDGPRLPVVPVGVGSFVGAEAARRSGLDVVEDDGPWAVPDTSALPAAAVAFLCSERGDVPGAP